MGNIQNKAQKAREKFEEKKMEEFLVQVEKVQAPILKPDLGFGCRY